MISQVAGRAAVTVTSVAAVPMLSGDTAGVSLPTAFSFTLTLTTDQDVAVKVYVAAGANCGLVLVSGWSATATSAAPYVLQVSASPCQRIYVTAQASSTTATNVNCDLLVQSSAVN
ncbi:MAG: hypothetical protein ACRCZ2_02585 [Fusobacteriaceae bacterium]|jgi:hypothetical protein